MLREEYCVVAASSSDYGAGFVGEQSTPDSGMVGSSQPMRRLIGMVDRLAPRDLNILVTGETGTGKELVARMLHQKSGRFGGPFVRVNCGAIPPSLAESELFGHERGSFTGASRTHRGYFGMADGGTLQLDEVEALPLEVQPKVLRALEDGDIQTVGRGGSSRVDVRVVACTNVALETGVEAGWFRADLYYRLAVVRIGVPPLRDRREDIAALARHFARAACDRFGMPGVTLSSGLLSALEAIPWPGNVRQLEHVITSMVALADGPVLDESALPREMQRKGWPETRSESLRDQLAMAERRIIQEALASCRNNRSQAAKLLRVGRTTLLDRMKKLGLREGGRYGVDPHFPL